MPRQEKLVRLLEFESKEILKKYRIHTPASQLVSSTKDIHIDLPVMLKAQIPMGGRSKAGGVLEASTPEEAKTKTNQLLSKTLNGYKAKKILAEKKVAVEQEFFLAVTYDTVAKAPIAMLSREGGVNIETLSASEPEKVKKGAFSVCTRLPRYRAREIVFEAGISGRQLVDLSVILSRLADIFLDYDATVIEINPLALTPSGHFLALDCHMEIDDDALFRQNDIVAMEQDTNRFAAAQDTVGFERKAFEIDNLDHRGVAGRFISFDGTLGLIIGGGGASLTAFDAIKAHGGMPANYCEIGGNPSVFKVKELTRLILSMPGVRKIAVIMNVVSNTRVDLVARGVIKGILEAGQKPSETVASFRIPGAWEEEGFKILSKYGVPYSGRTVSIDEAAQIAVRNSSAPTL